MRGSCRHPKHFGIPETLGMERRETFRSPPIKVGRKLFSKHLARYSAGNPKVRRSHSRELLSACQSARAWHAEKGVTRLLCQQRNHVLPYPGESNATRILTVPQARSATPSWAPRKPRMQPACSALLRGGWSTTPLPGAHHLCCFPVDDLSHGCGTGHPASIVHP